MKIVYITGCLGFMGSYFTRKCLDKGWKVYGIDKETYAADQRRYLEFITHDNFHFRQVDIKDLDHLYDCDYVINFAAESHVGNSIVDSSAFINTNILGTKNLLDLIRFKQSNVVDKPVFFHISTDEVYGDIDNGEHFETDILKPSNPYSAAKAAADMLILAWSRTYDINYQILRPTNNYGKGQYPEKLIPLSVKNLMRGRKIKLHDQGEPIRNWLHADDTAESVMTIIEKGKLNEIYNVAGGFEQQNKETVRKIIEAFHSDCVDWKDFVDYSYRREGQDVRYALNDDKLKALGWEPKKVFDIEIQDIVEDCRENFRW
tara:strand:- start:137 stop:1087 length:951 start_codon:yes stop_codon:yes gene_type:complete